jgi:hypothetical protein
VALVESPVPLRVHPSLHDHAVHRSLRIPQVLMASQNKQHGSTTHKPAFSSAPAFANLPSRNPHLPDDVVAAGRAAHAEQRAGGGPRRWHVRRATN